MRRYVGMSDLTNHDLSPVPAESRTWTWGSYAALWIGMAHNVPTWSMAGGLIALGMTWWQTLLTIAVGNLIVLGVILVNSHGGTKYGIPFPILARSSFGVRGANVPAVVRGVIAAVWFGINTHIGGQALRVLIAQILPAFDKLNGDQFMGQGLADWICFIVFLILNLMIVRKGMETLRRFEVFAGPAILIVGIGLSIWAYNSVGSLGPILHTHTSASPTTSNLWLIGLMSVIGFWATLSVNAPDFTRFARSQKDQFVGQTLGLPTTMVIFAFLGILTTSATSIIFGKVIWDPVELIHQLHSGPLTMLALVCVIIATMSVNVPANLVSPSYDFSNLAPRRITMWRGALITAVLAVAIAPWHLMATASTYIFTWLGTSSLALGPVAGILFADYWLVRKKVLEVDDLYKADGIYTFYKGFNLSAFAAIGVALILIYAGQIPGVGETAPVLKTLCDAGWLTGFTTATLVHWLLMKDAMGNKNSGGRRAVAIGCWIAGLVVLVIGARLVPNWAVTVSCMVIGMALCALATWVWKLPEPKE